jgi:hypothetical protein
MTVIVNVAHVRLCHSRMMFVRPSSIGRRRSDEASARDVAPGIDVVHVGIGGAAGRVDENSGGVAVGGERDGIPGHSKAAARGPDPISRGALCGVEIASLGLFGRPRLSSSQPS